MRRKAKHVKERNTFIKILLMLLTILAIYSVYNIILWLKQSRDEENLKKDLKMNLEVSSKENMINDPQDINIDFEELKKINSDVVGWIKIDTIELSNPIVKSTDNDYYLKRNFYKEYNICGTLFMDYRNKSDFSNDNNIIYGHNMKNGLMFGKLKNIYNGQCGVDIKINLYTDTQNNTYQVFSSYEESPNIDIVSEDINKNYVEYLKNKSNISFKEVPLDTNRIITLVTCNYTGKRRVIVHGYLLED